MLRLLHECNKNGAIIYCKKRILRPKIKERTTIK